VDHALAVANVEDLALSFPEVVRAQQEQYGLQDACLAFAAPLISGKDSMKNDFDDGTLRLSIPPTLLVSAIAKIPDADSAISMEFKNSGDLIYLLTTGRSSLKGSHYAEIRGTTSSVLPAFDFSAAPILYKILHHLIMDGMIGSAHDLSEGGLAVSLVECIIGSGLGAEINISHLQTDTVDDGEPETHPAFQLFAEGPGRIVVTVAPEAVGDLEAPFADSAIKCIEIGKVVDEPQLLIRGLAKQPYAQLDLETLEKAWKAELPL
jgi:phosphoribosylformylglycinamidine synthase